MRSDGGSESQSERVQEKIKGNSKPPLSHIAHAIQGAVGTHRLPSACRTGMRALTSLSPATCAQSTKKSEPFHQSLCRRRNRFPCQSYRCSDSVHDGRGVLLHRRAVVHVRFICCRHARAVVREALAQRSAQMMASMMAKQANTCTLEALEELERPRSDFEDFLEKLDAVRVEVRLHERPRLLHQRLGLFRLHFCY